MTNLSFSGVLPFLVLGWCTISGYSENPEEKTLPKKVVVEALRWDQFSPYIQKFNAGDEELYPQYYPNSQAEDFLKENIPLFECPDKQLEETYYFRWWTFRKHIQKSPEGFVITEFLPKVAWSGKYNAISCAAAHHINEGRWLHNQPILADYEKFWLYGGGSLRTNSFLIADGVLKFNHVHPDRAFLSAYYPKLKENFSAWERGRKDTTKLFWQDDAKDGMEAWKQLMDTSSFYAPFGPTTAERRSPKFAVSYKGHECQGNGPSWPFSTSITLNALANLLNNSNQQHITRSDYYQLLKNFSLSHRLKKENGAVVSWIDENLNPFTGDWLARTRLKTYKNGTRDYFCLDKLLYKEHLITVLCDQSGKRNRKGKGFTIFVDGVMVKSASQPGRLEIKFNPLI